MREKRGWRHAGARVLSAANSSESENFLVAQKGNKSELQSMQFRHSPGKETGMM